MTDSANFIHKGDDFVVTKSLFLFLKDYYRVVDHFFFQMNLAMYADKVFETSTKALIKSSMDEQDTAELKSKLEEGQRRSFSKLEEFGGLNSRNITNNIVDAFLWYLSSIIQDCASRRPEIITSSQTVKVAEVLQFRRNRDLVSYLVDKKINQLAYGGMDSIAEYISSTLGCELFDDKDVKSSVRYFIEVRNINSHNRGFASRIFLDRTQKLGFEVQKEGKRVHLDYDELTELSEAVVETATRLDVQLSKKFKIKRSKFSTWNADRAK
ncbi:hypothetical protein [Ruegeria jejuensis]|uniref:hypothetical protein n=1 Tax=Ruegeria jejuensis TaxID=3233338 RepID=UPI00355C694E